MTIAVTLMAKQRGGPSFVAQLLYYPVTDAGMDTDSYHEFAEGYVLTVEGMTWFWDQYLPDKTGWNGEIARLAKDGYPVIAPANPLRGLTSDADYIRSVLQSINGPNVLVGHSHGGAVISNAARGVPNVKALV
ncbi:MAG: hypothetical protein QOF87_1787 [Pseudonocardiales bacterium]|nr:hypothetical protein [Pseudonocardiales bacterium]